MFLSGNDDFVVLPDQLCPALPIDVISPPLRGQFFHRSAAFYQAIYSPRHAPLLCLIPSIAICIFYRILLPPNFEEVVVFFRAVPYSTVQLVRIVPL
jgi:hypothetical protein